MTGEVKHTASAYLTFVALGADGRPMPGPGLIAETDEDRRRCAEAAKRYDHRKSTKNSAS
jgi:acyl-CoA hydrolase